MGRVYAVASAKGGVGKTTTTANLGTALAAAGNNVVVVDADVGMPNLGRMLGVSPDGPSLHDVLAAEADPLDAVYDGPEGLAVVPGTTTLEDYVKANPRKLKRVIDALVDDYDFVLVDTGAGLSHDTVLPLGLADRVVLVSTPSPDALGDTAKTAELADRLGAAVAGIVLTRVDSDRVDVDSIASDLDYPLMGVVPEDVAVEDASADAEPVLTSDPDSPAAAAYRALADAISADTMQESFEAPVADDHADDEGDEGVGASNSDGDERDDDDSADAVGVVDEADEADDEDEDATGGDTDTEDSSDIDVASVLDDGSEDDLDELFDADEEELDETFEGELAADVDASFDETLEQELDAELASAFDTEDAGTEDAGTEDAGTEDADTSQSGGLASALADAEGAPDTDATDTAADESAVADAVVEAEPNGESDADEAEPDDVTFETAPEAETSDVTVQPGETPTIPDAERTAASDAAGDDEETDDEKQNKKGLFGRFFG